MLVHFHGAPCGKANSIFSTLVALAVDYTLQHATTTLKFADTPVPTVKALCFNLVPVIAHRSLGRFWVWSRRAKRQKWPCSRHRRILLTWTQSHRPSKLSPRTPQKTLLPPWRLNSYLYRIAMAAVPLQGLENYMRYLFHFLGNAAGYICCNSVPTDKSGTY